MSNYISKRSRVISMLMVLLMLLSTAFVLPLTASADSVTTKQSKTYEIAVAFDNSGSMYNDAAWCRAKYAMEIFASMLNYNNGDKLSIFPMWEVDITGNTSATKGQLGPVNIESKEDIDKITKMFSVEGNGNTPLAPIDEAYQYLKNSSATDKWLLVLTDGKFNMENREDMKTISDKYLLDYLKKRATDDINVQYLGFGAAVDLKKHEGNNFYATNTTDKGLKDDLIEICNKIFQRSVLPSNRLSGKTIDLDLSMKTLIVFVQGADAKVTSFKDKDGKDVTMSLDSGQRKYSTISAKGRDAQVDKSLAGQVVTYSDCAKGKYTLEYANANPIQIFYEPDVDVKVTLTNSDGQVVDGSSGEITAGEYTITSIIVDNKTGEDVTSHELMGNDVTLTTYVKTSADSDYKTYKNGEKITLDPDSSTSIIVKGTYLKIYEITSEDNADLAWLTNLQVTEPKHKIKVDAQVLQPQSWYQTTKHEQWEPVKVTVSLDGQPLTDDQLGKTTLNITPSKDLTYYYEPVKGESAFNVYIGHDKDGKYAQPECGRYKLNIAAIYTDENQKEITGSDKVAFDIQWYSSIWKWLFWIVLFVLLLILIFFILGRPAFPRTIYLEIPKTRSCPVVKRSGSIIALSTDTYPGELRCEAKACTPLKNRKKRIAKFKVKKMLPMGGVQWYEINGTRFVRGSNGSYVDDTGKTLDAGKPITVGHGSEIRWKTNAGTRTGIISINTRMK